MRARASVSLWEEAPRPLSALLMPVQGTGSRTRSLPVSASLAGLTDDLVSYVRSATVWELQNLGEAEF